MNFKTVREAAKLLGMSEPILRRGIQNGKYPAMKIGKRTVVEMEAAAIVRESEVKPGIGIQEISEKTGLAVNAVRRGIHEGWLPAWQRGRAYQFDEQEVRAALVSRMSEKK